MILLQEYLALGKISCIKSGDTMVGFNKQNAFKMAKIIFLRCLFDWYCLLCFIFLHLMQIRLGIISNICLTWTIYRFRLIKYYINKFLQISVKSFCERIFMMMSFCSYWKEKCVRNSEIDHHQDPGWLVEKMISFLNLSKHKYGGGGGYTPHIFDIRR